MESSIYRGESPDSDLIRGLKKGDNLAWNIFYDQYKRSLRKIIQRVVKDNDLTDEILQTTYLKVWSHLDKYDATKGAFFTWLSSIAWRQAIDCSRSQAFKKQSKTSTLVEGSFEIESAGTMIINTSHLDVRGLIRKLKPSDAHIVDLVYYQGYTQLETSRKLMIPLGTVKSRLRRSMISLKKLYSYCKTT